ncbi:hypothetical protein JOF29_003404 [Kribbella aluminosa]|uniref:HNH nuclease domain-containing protein n=1 Tax=Kribbella aluminosa TaxID=416017 RepID=A0ABS4UKY7_9ACTN|nr:HNH endonuclease signature motif containing protein [Kribbella aluminosa]MBP2352321.1 hypothetical protein [Kribbella aluminosa]
MEILGERPVWSMSGAEMVSTLDAAYAEIARLETLVLHLTAGIETIGYAKELGAGTTTRFLTFRYRVDATKARRDVQLATALTKYPAVEAALPDLAPGTTADEAVEDAPGNGVWLHPAQAEAIVSALEKLPDSVPVEDLAVAEREMVELGRTHGPLDLRKAGVQVRNRLDTDGPEPAEREAYDREALKLKTADNGVAFTGFLANENAELFRTLIHTHAKPRKTVDGALDPRSRDKRQADALTTVLSTAPHTATAGAAPTQDAAHNTAQEAVRDSGPDSGPDSASGMPGAAASDVGRRQRRRSGSGHGPTPQIVVTIDFDDLKAATANATGQLIYGEALSAATIRRLACDAQILPVVLGSDSQPLDLGTSVRLATGPIRKALTARDKGCVCCGAPPLYCDAHHVLSWIDGGETKLDNLVLLCKRCHRDLHAGHWQINITHGTVQVARPTWATPDPVPRNRYRPPTITPHTAEPTAGALTRAWPRDTDPAWITAADAVRLNPSGDTTDETRTREHLRNRGPTPEPEPVLRPVAGFAPWREDSDAVPHAVIPEEPSGGAGFDVWGEAPGDEPIQVRPDPGATHPWREPPESRGDNAA